MDSAAISDDEQRCLRFLQPSQKMIAIDKGSMSPARVQDVRKNYFHASSPIMGSKYSRGRAALAFRACCSPFLAITSFSCPPEPVLQSLCSASPFPIHHQTFMKGIYDTLTEFWVWYSSSPVLLWERLLGQRENL
jgi:hypothetical protein